jgi:hypothetical protein
MKTVIEKLLESLRNCDTTNILTLYDVSNSHIAKENYRTFIKEDIISYCDLFNQVTLKAGIPSLKNLSFTTDPQTGANIAILPLVSRPDTTMNLRNCTLYVMFYPDRFFNEKILRFTIVRENIKPKEPLKLENISLPN